jgi:hypothetical protein
MRIASNRPMTAPAVSPRTANPKVTNPRAGVQPPMPAVNPRGGAMPAVNPRGGAMPAVNPRGVRMGMKKGGEVSSASKRADGCAIKGKTKGRIV